MSDTKSAVTMRSRSSHESVPGKMVIEVKDANISTLSSAVSPIGSGTSSGFVDMSPLGGTVILNTTRTESMGGKSVSSGRHDSVLSNVSRSQSVTQRDSRAMSATTADRKSMILAKETVSLAKLKEVGRVTRPLSSSEVRLLIQDIKSRAAPLETKMKEVKELSSRAVQILETFTVYESEIRQLESSSNFQAALQDLAKTLLQVSKLVDRAHKTRFCANMRAKGELKVFIRDLLVNFNQVVMSLSMGVSQTNANSSIKKALAKGLFETEQSITPEQAVEMCLKGDRCFYGHGAPQNYEKAFEFYLQSAHGGFVGAMKMLAGMHERGEGIPKDTPVAFEWYNRAAEKNDADALYHVGRMFEKGFGPDGEVDLDSAVSFYKQAAEMNHADALADLGYMYEHGAGGLRRDYLEASHLYLNGAEQGNARAQNNLGSLFYRGLGVPLDYTQAVQWFKRSADQGNANAMNNLGICYEAGHGVLKDDDMAKQLYSDSLSRGNLHAATNLGFLHMRAGGFSGNQEEYEKAAALFRMGVGQGSVDAMYYMGLLFENGLGVDKDGKTSFSYYRRAADAGHVKACTRAGSMLYSGAGVARPDPAKAMEYYKRAAEEEDPEALNHLGILYEEGKGTDISYETAVRCFERAAELGNVDAMCNLAFLMEKGLGFRGPNKEDAMQLLHRAANLGSVQAQITLAQRKYTPNLEELECSAWARSGVPAVVGV
eukprot:GILK01009382.1.p1 GENE.GILK01009382.1~~GILK01009382.1.p1  ORF type:complete len:715 (+),score=107.63 GILK01009382.1:72-2216(+)